MALSVDLGGLGLGWFVMAGAIMIAGLLPHARCTGLTRTETCTDGTFNPVLSV